MPDSRLTWHRGSVLPYASRWHTVMRACALNALRSDEPVNGVTSAQAAMPWCWLYQGVDGQFVARWENARLQVCAATPAAAIAGLRRCATMCPDVGGVALPYPAFAPVARLAPMSTTVAAEYRLFIDCVKARRGFWSEAAKLARTAGGYRQALATADQTRRNQKLDKTVAAKREDEQRAAVVTKLVVRAGANPLTHQSMSRNEGSDSPSYPTLQFDRRLLPRRSDGNLGCPARIKK
ncbi:hypothetical protein PPGU19_090200 (plasmid) [Paraburkholderia sp. PGU19]|uniref:hypothetical protein n=1 Tax=Paraburkholderia sp. PGU19 TaxID=2735434 RepID=UPI0015DB4AE4|nr:hypothetical protein [Paraburkholderia sp. PGU19]BCG04452.1 hypothetical protein PPGU19_090200 [Paraburkholderia sp. PGU19]